MDYFQGRYTIQNIKEVVSTSQIMLAKVMMTMAMLTVVTVLLAMMVQMLASTWIVDPVVTWR